MKYYIRILYVIVLTILIPSCRKEGEVGTIIKDIDGNEYTSVIIGTQIWMVENLKTTRYCNGDLIINVADGNQWFGGLQSGAYCDYKNDTSYSNIYGCLYNGHAVLDSRKLAPLGWHIPTDEEWEVLFNHLGGKNVAGGKIKEAGNIHWNAPNSGATNESGFTALPAGERWCFDEYNLNNSFEGIGWFSVWWSLTKTYRLDHNSSAISNYYDSPIGGFSVRCIKD